MSTSVTTTAPVPPDTLAGRYLNAWQRHDIVAVMALHTADTAFVSAASGIEAIGHAAVREAIISIFTVWPDLHFRPQRVHMTPDVVVAESLLTVTQALPLPLGDRVVQPTGQTVEFPIADILEIENGLVRRKSSYFDALRYLTLMGAG